MKEWPPDREPEIEWPEPREDPHEERSEPWARVLRDDDILPDWVRRDEQP